MVYINPTQLVEGKNTCTKTSIAAASTRAISTDIVSLGIEVLGYLGLKTMLIYSQAI